jgi:hypothetical protein
MKKAATASIAIIAALVVAGCGEDETTPQDVATCAADNTIGTECAGVPSAPLCSGSTCTEGANCASVVTVATDADMQSALAQAQPGTCVALQDGTYGNAIIPAGVSLLGRGAGNARVGGIEAHGDGTTIKGVTSSGGGIRLSDGALNVRIEAVRIENSGGDGVLIGIGAGVDVVRSEIVGSQRYGVSAFGAAGVSLVNTIVSGNKGPGLWAECDGGCACITAKVFVSLQNTIIRDNKRVGVSLVGADATFAGVDIRDQGVTETSFTGGAGLSVSGCSILKAITTRVLDNTDFGVLIDDSTANLGTSGGDEGFEVSRNQVGLWIQNIGQSDPGQSVSISGGKLLANSAVGLGLDGSSKGIIIYGTEVRDTILEVVPVLVGGVSAGAKEVGDGVNWLGMSYAAIDGLTVSGSARQSFLIDGEVASGSSIANVQLELGDDMKGILQQSLPSGGVQPTLGAGTPQLTVDMNEKFAVPEEVGVPDSL